MVYLTTENNNGTCWICEKLILKNKDAIIVNIYGVARVCHRSCKP